jgi:hypothetical protein
LQRSTKTEITASKLCATLPPTRSPNVLRDQGTRLRGPHAVNITYRPAKFEDLEDAGALFKRQVTNCACAMADSLARRHLRSHFRKFC